MRILIAVTDIYSSVGGGQSFYADVIRAYPEHQFWYVVTQPVDTSKLPSNVHVLPMAEVYRQQAQTVCFESSEFGIGGMSLAGKEGDILYILDLAASTAGHSFDMLDIPDFMPFGCLFPLAMRHVGTEFGHIALSMHGTLTNVLTDNWGDNSGFRLPLLGLFEELLYRTVDVRYGIGAGYLDEWNDRTGLKPLLFDLASVLDMKVFREFRALRTSGQQDVPKLVFVGRQEKCKGPDLFVDLVASLPRDVHSGGRFIGPSVHIGGGDSWHELTRMAERRRIKIEQVALSRQQLLNGFATQDWVTVLPSRLDTFNLAALESLLCGTPTAISQRAGACAFFDRAFPGLPYVKLDPDDLFTARLHLLDLLAVYRNERTRIADYLETAEPLGFGHRLTEIYQHEPNPDLAARQHLASLFDAMSRHVEDRAIGFVRTRVRDTVANTLTDAFRGLPTDAPQRLMTIFDQFLQFREIEDRIKRQLAHADALNDEQFAALSAELMPFCFSGNRIPVYRLLAELEGGRGNELLFATYHLRNMRLSGRTQPLVLDQVCEILRRNDFAEEAEVARMLYGGQGNVAATVAYLRDRSERFRTPPAAVAMARIDRRTLDNPKISIIVSLFNAASKLPVFLRGISLFTTTTLGCIELILIDSNSSDNTEAVVLEQLDRIEKSASGAISTLYLRTMVRETIQRAWNRGIVEARGSYLAFLGADEMNRPDTFDILAEYLDRNPDVDWVQGTALITEVNEHGSFVRDVMPYNRLFNSQMIHYLDVCYIGFVGALYRRSLHDRVGFYDDRFRAAGDVEFKNRALPKMQIKTLPECFGVFLNYPEERTTQSPTAELEDIRAWYLYRSVAGMTYAFDGKDSADAADLFFQSLSYRKSYMDLECTDLDLANAVSEYLLTRWDYSFRKIVPHRSGVRVALDAYRVIDGAGELFKSFGRTQACQEFGGIMQNLGGLLAEAARSFSNWNQPITLELTNDNRFHQHHTIWPSHAGPGVHTSPGTAEIAPIGEASSLAEREAAWAEERLPLASAPSILRTNNDTLVPRFLFNKKKTALRLASKGDRARDDRDWQNAAMHYEKALNVDPRLTPIWVQYGHTLKEQGYRVAAETAYRQSLALDHRVADSHLQLGHVLKLQGRASEAAQAYFQALVLDPDLSYPREELAFLGYSEREIAVALATGVLVTS